MNGIKLLSLMLRDLEHLHGEDAEAVLLELLDDVADRVAANSIRFDDGQSTLKCFHKISRSLVFSANSAAVLRELCG